MNRSIVRVLTRLGAGGPPIHSVLLTRELSKFGYSSILLTGRPTDEDGDMSYLLHSDDPVRFIPEMSRKISPWADLKTLIALCRHLRRTRPQIVHTHTAKAGALGRIAACLTRVPVVVHTFHGNVLHAYFSRPVSWVVRQLERALAHGTDAICVLGPQQAFEIVERYRIAPRGKVHVIPLGMDLSHLENLASLANLERVTRNGGRITVGWLGRFVAVKNIPLLLASVKETLRRTDSVRFVVAGDGPEAPRVKNLAAELGSERFAWLGWRQDVSGVLAECDVLMQTSHNEGTPVALIEGMAAGRPFVSTPAGGVVDMVSGPMRQEKSGCRWFDNAILTTPEPGAFASALCWLAENQSELRNMGANAALFARAHYSLPSLLSSLDRLYSNLLDQKAAVSTRTARSLEGA